MKRNFLQIMFVVTIAIAVGIDVYNSKKPTIGLSDITMNNVEALAGDEGILNWWERCDYKCVSVTCKCLFGTFQSNVAQRVDEGTGTVPHSWSCTGCGDCGWSMN